ncbi:respiratory nitrate reductase subunit gamma [Candidatus Deferrimicrobium sp.]|uniref:respiratory nitrate reductase subunit gamma n=1 Tax=Candidatus Deferrimicrobium sp. TaxID=3060586 RepID=UPI003C56AF9E
MNTYEFIVGGILPYLAVLTFVVGMAYRFNVWFNTPQPARMTLFPAPQGSTAKAVLAEALLFPSLFKGDKLLWTASWVFHATLVLVFVGHVRVFTGLADSILLAAGMTPADIDRMSLTSGVAAGVVLFASATLLLARRLTSARVRQISGVGDFVALLLLLGILATGDLLRFGAHFDLAQTREWAWSLLSFSPVVPHNPTFLAHAFLALLLIAYIPFSKVLHFGGIFFSQSALRR